MRLGNLVHRFARITTSGRYIPVIDGLRFVSIMIVILFHASGYFRTYPPAGIAASTESLQIFDLRDFGYWGVRIFFIISGFILALPFALHHLQGEKSVNLRSYYKRRITRLEPPYIIALTILLILTAVMKATPIAELLPHYFARLIYIHEFIYETSPIVGDDVFWSLAIEVQFYLIAPLIARVFKVQPVLTRRAVLIATIIVLNLLTAVLGDEALSTFVILYMRFFLLGFLLADFYVTDWKQKPEKQWIWDMAGLIGWGLLFSPIFTQANHLAGYTILQRIGVWMGLSLILFGIFVAAFRGPVWNRVLSLRGITLIGGMCYTLYMYHSPIISAFGRLTTRLTISSNLFVNYLIQMILLLIPVMVLSAILFLCIEKPTMDPQWPKHLSQWIVKKRVLRATPQAQDIAPPG